MFPIITFRKCRIWYKSSYFNNLFIIEIYRTTFHLNDT